MRGTLLQHMELRRAIAIGVVFAFVAAVVVIFLDVSASDPPVMAGVEVSSKTLSYNVDIAPILQKKCLSCHSATTHKSGLVLDSYSALMKGGRHGQVVTPHDSKASRLMQMLSGETDPQMPLESDPLPAAQIAAIKSWIDAGAPAPSTNDAQPAAVISAPDIRPEVETVSPVTAVKFSPNGGTIAVGGYRQVRLIDPVSGKVLTELDGHPDSVRAIAFSPDGKLLATAGSAPQSDGEIRIWNLASYQLLKILHGHKDCIYSLAWSPDGKLIASGSYDKTVKLWDVSEGKELRNLQDHIDAVFAVAFSPDGRHLASASQDRTVKIWEVATGRRLFTLSDALDGLTSIAYSPSGDRIAAAGYDKTIYIWELTADDGHLSQSLIADEDSLLAIAWSPDGRTIITASSDGSIRFRNAATLDPTGLIDKQSDWVQSLDLSSDGTMLAAGRYDGTLGLYDVRSLKELRPPMMVFDPHGPANDSHAKEVAGK